MATPAAVMVEFSPEFEVSIIKPDLPPGVSQQRKVEAMTEEERRPEKEMPKLLVHEEAELKIAAAKPEPKAKKENGNQEKKPARTERRERQFNDDQSGGTTGSDGADSA